jgi:hypothetical protein
MAITAPAYSIPLATEDPKKRLILSYSERGLRSMHPTYITNFNAASHEGCGRNLLTQLPVFRQIIANGQYPFIRLDVNLYFSYIKVQHLHGLTLCLLVHGGKGFTFWWQPQSCLPHL